MIGVGANSSKWTTCAYSLLPLIAHHLHHAQHPLQGCSMSGLANPYPKQTTNLGFQRNLVYRERWVEPNASLPQTEPKAQNEKSFNSKGEFDPKKKRQVTYVTRSTTSIS